MKRICLLVLLCTSLLHGNWQHVSFDDAMQKNSFACSIDATKHIVEIEGVELYDFFKDLYDVNNPSALMKRSTGEYKDAYSDEEIIDAEATLRIPKIIHQIWLGSPVPESFKQLQQSWFEHHADRGWCYKLWTDEDVEKMTLYNQEFYDATDNYGVKSDILRWEVLYHFGGVYVDMDYECLQPLDALHHLYDFYTAIQPLDTSFVQLGAALFGTVPGHPLLKRCIEGIKDSWHHKGAPKKTGPVHFTKIFYEMAGKDGMIDIAFPSYYFYPLGCRQADEKRLEWIASGSYAVHWWAKSWMPKNYRPAAFRNLNNDESAVSWND